MKKSHSDDYLWLHLKDLPYFRGLLRAVETTFYQDYTLPSPILDLGCGDGHFASIAFDQSLDFGVDPWGKPLKEAVRTDSYKLVLQSLGSNLPFPSSYFNSIISNSVLEHIQDLSPVLDELARVIKPNGLFLFCVPNHNFLPNLSISGFMKKGGLSGIARLYENWFNLISRHYHCDPPEIWEERLSNNGFNIERFWHYFSPAALHALEWGHYFGLPSLLIKYLTGKWILIPKKWNLFLTRNYVEPYYLEDTDQEFGSYTFFVARKRA